MPWDTEGTKQKILDVAVSEFAKHGPDGTTIDKIAKIAGVNKERIYNYFGAKRELFDAVLRNELVKVAKLVPIQSIYFFAEIIALFATSKLDFDSAAKIPPVCSHRAPRLPKISSQSKSSGAN